MAKTPKKRPARKGRSGRLEAAKIGVPPEAIREQVNRERIFDLSKKMDAKAISSAERKELKSLASKRQRELLKELKGANAQKERARQMGNELSLKEAEARINIAAKKIRYFDALKEKLSGQS